MEAKDRQTAKRFSRDLMYSVVGLVSMNAVIQLALYPLLQDWMGADEFGIALSLISVCSIMCVSFATGANFSHAVRSVDGVEVRGDYNVFMLVICAVSIVVAVVAGIVIVPTRPVVIVGFCALMVFSLLRYYGDVEFKLTLNYRGYLVYYLAVSAGYLLGLGLQYLGLSRFSVVDWWWFSILLGEVAAFVYLLLKGHIFRRPAFQLSTQVKRNAISLLALSSAYLLSGIIMNADRLLILAFVGSAEVTLFYISTLLGKTVSLLTAPLDGVIIGYLTKHDITVTRGFFAKLCVVVLIGGVVLSGITVGLSYPFIAILYPNLYDVAQPFFVVGSVGQVFYFLSEMLLVVVLRVASERWQLYLNIFYVVLYFAVTVPAVMLGGVWGIAVGILVVNVVRFLAVMAFGLSRAQVVERS